MFLPSFTALVLAAVAVDAYGVNDRHLQRKRQDTSSLAQAAAGGTTSSTTSSTASVSASSVSAAVGSATTTVAGPLATASATVSGVPPLSDITFGMPSGTTYAATTTYTSGTEPTISGLSNPPALPAFTFASGDWPTMDKLPPTDSDEVAQWMTELEGFDIPDLEPTTDGTCASNPDFAADAQNRGWWTCGHITRDTDVTVCEQKYTWGVSFDDGPSPYTGKLLSYLADKDISATFFCVGSRVISYPDVLREEYMAGHEISVHTWSHPYLTTLTNEQIVAELGWTRKAIKEVTGVTPTTMRPPYGDIDDRVRAIALAMGMVPIIWTVANGVAFDTNDWNVAGGLVDGEECVQTFDNLLGNATTIDTGIIVLEHDLFEITVDLAIGYNLETALSYNPAFTLEPIGQCAGIPTNNLYRETNTNTSFPYTNNTDSSSVSSGASTNSSSGSSSKNGASGFSPNYAPAVMVVTLVATLSAFL